MVLLYQISRDLLKSREVYRSRHARAVESRSMAIACLLIARTIHHAYPFHKEHLMQRHLIVLILIVALAATVGIWLPSAKAAPPRAVAAADPVIPAFSH